MATLDATQQRLLENAPDNPNSPKKAEPVAARPGLGFSKSTTGPPKPSLRETMLAQKKAAMANKNLPARPGSAMAQFSPLKTERTVSNSSTISTASDGPVRPRPESTTVAHGGLSVAPMRPTKFRPAPRPELAARPATAGPYSVRRPGHGPSNSDSNPSPSTRPTKARTPSVASTSPPKKLATRPATSHSTHSQISHASQSSHASPVKSTVTRVAPSPYTSPAKVKAPLKPMLASSPSKADEEFTMVVPTITGLKESRSARAPQLVDSSDEEETATPMKAVKVYEDPFSSTDDHTTPRPQITAPVLEEVAVNEDNSNLTRAAPEVKTTPISPEQYKQNSRLLESGISKIKAQSLDVHGFRKLQGLIRDTKATWPEEKFDTLLLGLFEYLEAPLTSLSSEKVQDVKAQILATIKLMYKKDREAFRPHVEKGLESLLATRACYDSRTHIVSGLELLCDELVSLADPQHTTSSIVTKLQHQKMTVEGCRSLSMGLHILKTVLEKKESFTPDGEIVERMCELAARCLESEDSGVRMDAVMLCVVVHERVGEDDFWNEMEGLKGDPKSLITYYVEKRRREGASS